jgi:hypothetical protein
MKEKTTIELSRENRDLLEKKKIIPEETCDHAFGRILRIAESKKVATKK